MTIHIEEERMLSAASNLTGKSVDKLRKLWRSALSKCGGNETKALVEFLTGVEI